METPGRRSGQRPASYPPSHKQPSRNSPLVPCCSCRCKLSTCPRFQELPVTHKGLGGQRNVVGVLSFKLTLFTPGPVLINNSFTPHSLFFFGNYHPSFKHRIRIQRDRMDSSSHKPSGKVRKITRSLTAYSNVFSQLGSFGDSQRYHALYRGM